MASSEAAIQVPKLEFPPITKHDAWVNHSTGPWRQFLARPTDRHIAAFVTWIFHLATQRDVPALYRTMQLAWRTLAPDGSRGTARQQLPAFIYLITHFALAVARCRSALLQKKSPMWFLHVWKVLPADHRAGIQTAD